MPRNLLIFWYLALATGCGPWPSTGSMLIRTTGLMIWMTNGAGNFGLNWWVPLTYILSDLPKGLAQNANAAFLGRFQLQSWRFVLPDAYREICRIMTAENLASRDCVYFLCRLPVVVEASNQTAFADKFPWNLTAVPGSQQASLKKIIRAYRDFRKVGSKCFELAVYSMY